MPGSGSGASSDSPTALGAAAARHRDHWVDAGHASRGLSLPVPQVSFPTHVAIIINAFVLPQQVVVIPLFTLWRQKGPIVAAISEQYQVEPRHLK
jgi:hypothetical protein